MSSVDAGGGRTWAEAGTGGGGGTGSGRVEVDGSPDIEGLAARNRFGSGVVGRYGFQFLCVLPSLDALATDGSLCVPLGIGVAGGG